ncbi:hypothetical protein [Streptomyces sp. I4(2020)]|uniref:hypothetical protein n=1 Tax=Streptomyces sp. I4(2020) TaxID=2760981 RepID=UPI0018EE8066|nr:hypothetical protein [Streptomyces sp. I4(2020)]MBJ6613260.1 hypothetical protein [Streptomyces sp. I3(2020)]MBJ6623771.1 hypothetical protein [Streptomyces sp. I4(2020)]
MERVLMDGAVVGLATGLVGAGATVIATAVLTAVLTAASGLLAARWKTEQRPASRCTTALPSPRPPRLLRGGTSAPSEPSPRPHPSQRAS